MLRYKKVASAMKPQSETKERMPRFVELELVDEDD